MLALLIWPHLVYEAANLMTLASLPGRSSFCLAEESKNIDVLLDFDLGPLLQLASLQVILIE